MKNNIAIIGAGRIGYIHAKAIKNFVPNFNILFIVDPFLNDEQKKLFQNININNFSKDVDVVLKNPEISTVYICTPTSTHYELIKKAIKNKKHIFCEKPVSLNLAEIEEIKFLLNKNENKNLKFTVGHNRRFDKNFIELKKMIEKQKSSILSIHITSRDPSAPHVEYLEKSGGIFADMMIHDFDMLRFITNSEVKSIIAIGNALIDPKIENLANDIDVSSVMVYFENGSIGTINNCRATSFGYDQRIEVHTLENTFSVENEILNQVKIMNNNGITKQKPLYFFLERYKEAYINENKKFNQAIINDLPVEVSINDAYLSIQIAKAAKKSLDEKRIINIRDIR